MDRLIAYSICISVASGWLALVALTISIFRHRRVSHLAKNMDY